MTIDKLCEGTVLTIKIDGRLDTTTAPQLDSVLDDALPGMTDVTLDCANMAYISSAGLRVLLKAQKVMNKQGRMKLIHVNEEVAEVFDITGFSDILTVE